MKSFSDMFKFAISAITLLIFSSPSYGQDMTSKNCASNDGSVLDLGGAKICMVLIRPPEYRGDVYEGLGIGVASCQNPYSKLSCSELFDVETGSRLDPLLKTLSDYPPAEVLGCARIYAIEADAFLDKEDKSRQAISRGTLANMRAGIFAYSIAEFKNQQTGNLSPASMTWLQCAAIVASSKR